MFDEKKTSSSSNHPSVQRVGTPRWITAPAWKFTAHNMEKLNQCQHCFTHEVSTVKLAWPCLKEQSLHLPGWKLTAHGDVKPMPGLLWTLSVHPRLTITPLKPRQISSVFSIYPDAHWTTTTLDNWRWDGSYPGPMDNLMMATLMRWWPPWTHGQPDDGYPDEMFGAWNLDPLKWTGF